MKHTKKWMSLVLALLLLVSLCLAGCDGSNTTQTTQGDPGTTAPSDPSVPSAPTDPSAPTQPSVPDPTTDPSVPGPTESTVPGPTESTVPPTTVPAATNPPVVNPPKPTNPPATQNPVVNPPEPTTPPATQPPAPATGTQANPAPLVIGNNTIPSGTNYYLTWTADKDCTLNLQLPDTGWSCQINNLTSGENGVIHSDKDEMVYNPMQVAAYKGDVLQIIVKLSKSGEVVASKGDLMGTSSNPLRVTEGTNTIRVPAGKTVYANGRIYGMTMTIPNAANTKVLFNKKGYEAVNGVITVTMPTGKPGNATPLLFSITNNTGADKVYTVTCKVPSGTFSNPEKLTLGSNTAAVAAGSSDGFVYTWTATGNGTLTLDMPNDQGWYYVINNLTTSKYGDPHYSDESPSADPGTITVKKGDEIQIIVSTYDPANPNTTPAGEVKFTASFA